MKNEKLWLLTLALSLALLAFAGTAAAQDNKNSAATQSATQGANQSPAQGQVDSNPALPAHKSKTPPVDEEDRITREVRHELVMQPYYTIWDWLAFRVNGSTVELMGDAGPTLKRDALKSVKHIEGVENVIDHINELPPSPMDDGIRRRVARAIFSWGGLSRYSWSAVPSIHIVVNGGRVRLEGIVDTQQDKDAAGIRANTVSGVFQVTNNLRVVKG
jgi:hyperosmotically inducible protein